MVERLNGDQFIKEAEKKLKSDWSQPAFIQVFLGNFWEKVGLGSKSERLEQASDLYKQAANAYKLQKRCNFEK